MFQELSHWFEYNGGIFSVFLEGNWTIMGELKGTRQTVFNAF